MLLLVLYRYGPAAIPRTRLHFFVVAFVAANALSVVTAENTYTSIFGERNRYLGLTNIVDLALLYLALVVAFRSLRDWLLVAGAAAGGTLAAIAYGTIQYLGRDPIGWSRDPSQRPFGTIGNEDMFGHLLATMIAASVALAFVPAPRRLRIAAAGFAAAATAMLALSGTRGSLLALAAALGIGAVLVVVTHGRAILRSRLFAVCVGLGVVLAIGLLLSPTGRRLLVTGPPLGDRFVLWQGSFRAFLARPILGWGPDGLATGFGRVRPLGMEDIYLQGYLLTDQAHNWILQAFETTGLVGGIALIALLAAFSLPVLRARRGPVAIAAWPIALAALAYWANGLTSPDSVSISWIPWTAFACAAWIAARAPLTVPPVRPLPALATPVVLALSLAVATTAGNAYRANAEILRAAQAYPRDANETILGAHGALTLDPGRADYWNYRGLGFQLNGQFALAIADFTEATRRAPYQPAYWINLSRARRFAVQNGDVSGGGQAAAYAAAAHAIEVEPRLSSPHRNYAEIALAFGDAPVALSEARLALALFAGDPLLDPTLAAACLQLEDRELARRVLEDAVTVKPQSLPLWVALAQVHYQAGNLTAARIAALRALQLDQNSAEARRILAVTGP
jgi:O-antigen ligase/Flp pilus assembly protein TadD